MSTAVRRGIYGRLAGDTTLSNLLGPAASGYAKGIYFQVAPAGAAFPYVIFQKQAGTPTDTFSTPGFMDEDVWLVKAVDRDTTADDAEAIAARVMTLLNDAPLSISGKSLLYLRRTSDVEYPEVENGVTYHHVGSLYRLITG